MIKDIVFPQQNKGRVQLHVLPLSFGYQFKDGVALALSPNQETGRQSTVIKAMIDHLSISYTNYLII